MFRAMRRSNQALSADETVRILERNTSGTLALQGDNGYPYAVPLSYVYCGGKIFFHSAKAGHKIDAVQADERASFCVIDQDDVVPEKLTTYYRSVIVFGRVRLLENPDEIYSALRLLGDRYATPFRERTEAEVARDINRTAIIELTIEQMTGKEAIELVRERRGESA